jgi:hypothetical protein
MLPIMAGSKLTMSQLLLLLLLYSTDPGTVFPS